MGSEERWGLANDDAQASSSNAQLDLLEIASELTDDDLEVVRYGPFAQKLSPILRDPKLRQFLLHLLTRAGRSLTLNEMIEVMRLRFSLPTDEVIQLDEGLSSPKASPADEATLRLGARDLISRLTPDEASVLEGYFRSGGVFSDAARSSGGDVQRIRNVVHRALSMICEYSDSEDEARTLMQTVESLLIQHGDRTASSAVTDPTSRRDSLHAGGAGHVLCGAVKPGAYSRGWSPQQSAACIGVVCQIRDRTDDGKAAERVCMPVGAYRPSAAVCAWPALWVWRLIYRSKCR